MSYKKLNLINLLQNSQCLQKLIKAVIKQSVNSVLIYV